MIRNSACGLLAIALWAPVWAVAAASTTVGGPDPIVQPDAQLKAQGMPPVRQSLIDAVQPYADFRGFGFVDWHPKRLEMLVRHRAPGSQTAQIFRLRGPGGALEQVTNFAEPVYGASYEPREGRYLILSRDTGGNEASRVYRLDWASQEPVLLSDPQMRSSARWTRRGDRLLISSLPLDRTAKGGSREQVETVLSFVDPLNPQGRTEFTRLPGGGWSSFVFRPDDQQVAAVQYRTGSDSDLVLIDAQTAKPKRILPAPGMSPAGFFSPRWSLDGQKLFLLTNLPGEFLQLAVYDIAKEELKVLSQHIAWDIESFTLSEDGKYLLAVVNNNGRDEMRLFAADSGAELPRPEIPQGAMSAGIWHETQHQHFAFSLNSPKSPGDVYSYEAGVGVRRWTSAYADPRVNAQLFVNPELVQTKSFDGLLISGWLFRPDPAKFPGKRPVLVDFHGGPEGQSTVRFMGRYNYLIQEMGIALLLPNVRGSTGYGKTFLNLDNGFKRKDSVKDGGAFLDWIAREPGLDAARVVVSGGSYGGYMSLAMAVDYSPQLRGAIDIVGISNFVTFLKSTESYRRDLRRVEYGDERDPLMRDFQERIAPVNNANSIRVPLFVVQGKNDPRVPYTEAEQIVGAVRQNAQAVWYLLAENEGHGFARKSNADYLFYSMINFLKSTLFAHH